MHTVVIKKGNRSYDQIDSLIIVIAAIAISFEYKIKNTAIYNPGDYVALEGLSTHKIIRLPLHGPIEAALQNLKPDTIEITVEDMAPTSTTYQVNTSALQNTIDYIFSPYFVAFYENNFSAAKTKFGTDFITWPVSWRMGWIVRNALSHNQKIYFTNLSTPAITWKGVTISPNQQNIPLRNILNFTDILLLLFDMERDLL
ncbi:hypothetical protein ACHRV1_25630 [Flavobacterium aquidurense]|uniref:hypothetical protein n=1 Tax=Flavobacterium aquidurense TaxID=362413 RepID=UPI0037574F88